MSALSTSTEGACRLCVPPDPGIQSTALGTGEAAALGASVSAAPGAGEAAALGARESAPSAACSPVAVSLADPSGGPVIATSSTVLPCPAVPSGTLSGLHLPSFSTNLVAGCALQDGGVHQFTPAYERVTHCTCARMGRHLATFTRQPGSDLYTLTTESPQVAASASAFASASGQLSAPCSCRSLAHETVLWHHRLGHPSVQRLRAMHSRYLVSGLPRSFLPSLPRLLLPAFPVSRGGSAPPLTPPRSPRRLLLCRRSTWTCGAQPASVVRELHERFRSEFSVLRLHSDRGGEFSSDLLAAYCAEHGIEQSFTLPASPQQNGVAERRIGLVMEVARTSLIHAAAPHFLWPFAVRSTTPPRAGFCPLRTSLLTRSVPYYRLFPYRTAPLPPPPLFLAPGAVVVDPLPPQGAAPSCVSQVDPAEPVEVAVDSRPAGGAEPGGAEPGGAEPGGAEPGGAESEGAEPGGAESGGAEPGGAELEGAESGGAEPGGVESGGTEPGGAAPGGAEPRSPESGGSESGGAESRSPTPGGALSPSSCVSGTCSTTASGEVPLEPGVLLGLVLVLPLPVGSSPLLRGFVSGTSGAALFGVARLVVADPAGGGAIGATGGAAGAEDPGVGAAAGAADPGAGAAAAAGGAAGATRGAAGAAAPEVGAATSAEDPGVGAAAGAADPGVGAAAGAADAWSWSCCCLLPLLALVVESRVSVLLLSQAHTIWHYVLPLLHSVSLCRLLRRPLFLRLLTRSPTPFVLPVLLSRVSCYCCHWPFFESAAASALVAELVDFAATCRLDYAASLVAESESVCPPSVGGDCALGTDVLEDRQEEFECFAAALPHLVSMLVAPEGDPDAPDIPTPRSYAEAMAGPCSSQWQTTMDAEMASWKSTGTYVDEVPPPGANIVSGMWIFRVKRPPGSPPVFKARYVARGFSQREGVDFFQTFSPTPKMTTSSGSAARRRSA
ncbi:unnamed protein product [Closterium sp. NIES-64]|nr:unnamed protein product [Closterium sp. NIES-64]